MPRYAGVLFDLFGTLVHFDERRLPEMEIDGRRVRTTLGTLAPLCAELVPGVAPAALWAALRAVTAEIIGARATDHAEVPSRERFRRALARVGCDGARGAEGALLLSRAHMRMIADVTWLPPAHADVVAAARREHRLAVVSNFDDTATAYEILARLGLLAHLDTVVVSEAVGVRKPHPALVRVALHALGLEAKDCLFVGDTYVEDVLGAHAAGIEVAWIDRDGGGHASDGPRPHYVLGALPELSAVLCA